MTKKNPINISTKYFILFSLSFSLIVACLLYIIWETINLSQKETIKYVELPRETEIVRVVNEESKVIEVVAMASPAVVSIVATAEVPIMEQYFFDPFEHFFGPRREIEMETERIRVGAGTGFIVSEDGYIITNRHVVEDSNAEYTVFLNDTEHENEQVIAEVLALDPNNDLAILKIDKTDLPYLKLADSDNLQVGQTAITIGYALGEFDNTVSKGVVSGLSRSIVAGRNFGYGGERLYNLIQTDAAINQGNSGGPMLNIFGEVIGVNVAMARAENIGFAIPSNEAKRAFSELKATGTITEQKIAFLGIRYLNVNLRLKEANKLPYDYGALVIRGERPEELAVMPGSPADRAGILENDIILEFDGQKITERNPLYQLIRRYKPGDEVVLKIFSKGEEKELSVILDSN